MCRPAGWFTKDVNREVAAEVAAPDMMDYCEVLVCGKDGSMYM